MIDQTSRPHASSIAASLAVALALATSSAVAQPPDAPQSKATTPTSARPADPAPAAGASRSPFHPHTSAMLRQSNRLKAAGYGDAAMNDGEIALALHSATVLLSRAELDYQGHRARAIREVDAAIRQIRTKAGKAGAANAGPTPKPAASAVAGDSARAQEQSDAILREAHHALVKLESHMANGGNARRLAPARASVQRAIQELAVALPAR